MAETKEKTAEALRAELGEAWKEITRLKNKIHYLENIKPSRWEIVKAVLAGTGNMAPDAAIYRAYEVADAAVARWEKDNGSSSPVPH